MHNKNLPWCLKTGLIQLCSDKFSTNKGYLIRLKLLVQETNFTSNDDTMHLNANIIYELLIHKSVLWLENFEYLFKSAWRFEFWSFLCSLFSSISFLSSIIYNLCSFLSFFLFLFFVYVLSYFSSIIVFSFSPFLAFFDVHLRIQ